MSVVHDLVVAARRLAHVWRSGADDSSQDFVEASALRAQAETLFRELEGASGGADWGCTLRRVEIVDVPANRPPWLRTSISLEQGDEVTWLAAGRVWLSRGLDVWLGPGYALWARIDGRGPILSGTAATESFLAPHGGTLELGSSFPGPWVDGEGTLKADQAAAAAGKVKGGMVAVLLVWQGQAKQGVALLLERCRQLNASNGEFQQLQDLLQAEASRLARGQQAPQGWDHLWETGRSAIYSPALREQAPAIRCRTCADVGIVRKPIRLPLRKGTSLAWSWCLEQLPSSLPEDTMLSHDYLSIAVEFSNGKDLTYTWSQELPYETAYWCPLPDWKEREFHAVVRSGTEHLGVWLDEERDLFADYQRWIGEPPAEITAVWLIANSLMQRREGLVTYSDISLGPVQPEGKERAVVL